MLIVVGSILGYLVLGFVTGRYIARAEVAALLEANETKRRKIQKGYGHYVALATDDEIRNSARGWFTAGIFLWPVIAVVSLILVACWGFGKLLDSSVPELREMDAAARLKAKEAELARVEADIERLHEEIGVGAP